MVRLNSPNFSEILLLTRPYTWIEIVLIALVTIKLSFGEITLNFFSFLIVALSLLWWFSCNLLREAKKIGFCPFLPHLGLAILTISSLVISPVSVIFLALNLTLLTMYSLKSKNFRLGKISFISRGLVSASLIIFLLSLQKPISLAILISAIPFMATIFLITSSRNLIADVRDISVDKYSFPKSNGPKKSMALGGLLLSFAVAFLIYLGHIMAMLTLALMLGILFIFRDAYTAHRIYIIACEFFCLCYLVFSLGGNPALIMIAYLGVLLNFTYDSVPRSLTYRSKGKVSL